MNQEEAKIKAEEEEVTEECLTRKSECYNKCLLEQNQNFMSPKLKMKILVMGFSSKRFFHPHLHGYIFVTCYIFRGVPELMLYEGE